MRKYATALLSGFFASMLIAASEETRDFTRDEIIAKVAQAVGQCRTLIAEIDNMPESLWNPKLAYLSVPNTMRLFELQDEMSFEQYLDYINALKERASATKAHLDNQIINWNGSLHKLNLAISEDLRAFATFCLNPVNAIKDHLAKLQDVNIEMPQGYSFF